MANGDSLYNNPFAPPGAPRPRFNLASTVPAPSVAPAPSSPAPAIVPTVAPPDTSTSGPGPESQWQPSDYRQVQQAQLPKTGFAGLIQRALPIVQAIGGGVAAAAGNPLPAEMVMRQRQQQWADARQLGQDQKADQLRNIQIQSLYEDLQRKREANKANPPQTPQQLLQTFADQQAIKEMIHEASQTGQLVPDANGYMYSWQPKPGTHAIPVAPGVEVQMPNRQLSPVMVRPTEAPSNWSGMPGATPGSQGPVSPEEQANFLKTAPDIQLRGMPKGAVTPEDLFKGGITMAGQANTQAYRDAMLAIEQQRLAQGADKSDVARLDRSFQYNMNALDKVATPLEQSNQRVSRFFDTLDQHNIQADALIAPELLSFMAGGQGSGLRMNEAEIARIVGGRTQWQNLQAAANKWKTDPNSARTITPAQDAQIRSLARVVKNRIDQKLGLIDNARDALVNTDDVQEHRKILSRTKMMLDALDAGKPISNVAPAPSTPPPGATMRVPGSDGKLHWSDGKRDLGIVQ